MRRCRGAYVQTPEGEIYVEAVAVERLASAYDRLRGMTLGRVHRRRQGRRVRLLRRLTGRQ
jgi:hypothetical protein